MEAWDQLTNRQREVYDFVRDKIQGRGYGPTVREIGEHFEIRSPNGVMCHLKALEKKGLITRESNRSRAIQLTRESASVGGLPLAGRIAAGVLHEAIEQHEQVDFAGMFDNSAGQLFVLEVSGDSMIEDQFSAPCSWRWIAGSVAWPSPRPVGIRVLPMGLLSISTRGADRSPKPQVSGYQRTTTVRAGWISGRGFVPKGSPMSFLQQWARRLAR